jgi:hypothetical protein
VDFRQDAVATRLGAKVGLSEAGGAPKAMADK